jgi:ribosomal protein S17E
MKKHILLILIAIATFATSFALPKAFYVVKGDVYTKYSLGVAGTMRFTDGGHKLIVDGYNESINLDDIDYITLSAPISSTLTTSEQKQKLLDIGQETMAMVDLNDNPDAVNMVHSFFDCDYESGRHAPAEFDVPQEYWDVHNEFKSVIKALRYLIHGNATSARVLRTSAVNIYRFEDYTGIYTADYETRSWVRTAKADYFEMRFTGFNNENFTVTMRVSTEATAWASRDFDIRFPKTIDITFAKDGNKIASAKLVTTLEQDKKIDMTFDFEANKYVVNSIMEVTNTAVNDVTTVTIKNRQAVQTVANVEGKNLLNYDEMYDAIKEVGHYHDDEDNCCGEDGRPLTAHFIRATMYADLLGKLQINARANGFTKLYDVLSTDDDFVYDYDANSHYYAWNKILNHKGDEYTVTDQDIDVINKYISALNNYTDVNFSYDKNGKAQGYLTFDYTEDVWEDELWWGENDYYKTRYAYIENNGHLYSAWRDIIDYYYDYNTGEQINTYGPWYYVFYLYDEDDNRLKGVTVEVDESDLVYPNVIKDVSYEITPKLTFPDQTSFYFEDFFDEDTFEGLIDDGDSLVDTYYLITGQDRYYEDK